MALKDLQRRIQQDLPSEPEVELPAVVVIDDDPSVLLSLELLLRRRYRVATCSTGAEGLSKIDAKTAAVVLDIKMPGEDGFAVYDRIRAIDDQLPIIFHSAYQDHRNPYEVLNKHRPFAYMTKGNSSEDLLRVIADAVRKSELLHELRRIRGDMTRITS
jgi:DNA-binding NtrC family response regulator